MATITLPTEINELFETSAPTRVEGTDRFEIVLDVASDGADETPEEFGALFGLDVKVLEQNGPGGGWPVVQFTGSAIEIAALMVHYSNADAIRVNELVEVTRRVREL